MYVPGQGHLRRSLLSILDHYLDLKLRSREETPSPAPPAAPQTTPEFEGGEETVWEFAQRTGLLGGHASRGFGTYTMPPGGSASASLTIFEDSILHGITLTGILNPESVVLTGVHMAGVPLRGFQHLGKGIAFDTAKRRLRSRGLEDGNLLLRCGQVVDLTFQHIGGPDAGYAAVHADLLARPLLLPDPVRMLKDLQTFERVAGDLPPAWAACRLEDPH